MDDDRNQYHDRLPFINLDLEEKDSESNVTHLRLCYLRCFSTNLRIFLELDNFRTRGGGCNHPSFRTANKLL